ncbi:anti-sigma factor family protein [Algisphaera agarilytica]|uniref:Anti-sigma factor RsiW n=1 Tax=Algisphaera agarilytica TaxID=1385975 RepID=A0A7X0H3T1_9BACT|nr:hypothetical protein [Algisphaera agarilytica]MBB6428563.1 anti-sigma factor RsiW [Algisphaera agarilytica]
MSKFPHESDFEAINQYLDGLMSAEDREQFERRLEAEPDLAALLEQFTKYEQAEAGWLAQDAHAASDAVMKAIAAEQAGVEPGQAPPSLRLAGSDTAPAAQDTPPAKRSTSSVWAQALKIAACIAVVTTVYLAGQWLSPWDSDPRLRAGEMYAMLEESGFVAPRTCSPEQFPVEMQNAVGVSLAFAPDVPQVELLGWSYPASLGGEVLSKDEIILMAKVEGENVAVVIDQADQARRLRGSRSAGLEVHKEEIQGLVFYEVTPFDTPKILPLIQPTDGP